MSDYNPQDNEPDVDSVESERARARMRWNGFRFPTHEERADASGDDEFDEEEAERLHAELGSNGPAR